MVLALFAYAFLSNVALAIVPHEPIVIWYGSVLGVWVTAVVATLGTVAASWVDHRLFVPLLGRLATKPALAQGPVAWMRRRFSSAPFAMLAVSGLTPLPFYPFKIAALTERYPLGRYLAAIAVGRLPRYALLAWLGVVVHIPAWILIALFLALLTPSLRLLVWRRQSAR
jgi:membrane protein YqaA with SNARE-associated domain